MLDVEELKRFDFSGLEGFGWIEKINPENPRFIDFILRTNVGEMMKNRMFSLDIPPIFSSASYEARLAASQDVTTLVPNSIFETPLLVKLSLKLYGVKTLNRMEAHSFLEKFIVKTPVILPSFISLEKASTESCCKSFDKSLDKKDSRYEFKFKILPDRCRKTNTPLVRLFANSTTTTTPIPFEETVDKKGADGFIISKPRKRSNPLKSSKKHHHLPVSSLSSSQQPPHPPLTPLRKNAFFQGSKKRKIKDEKTKLLSPRYYYSPSAPTVSSFPSPLSISKFPTVVSSDSCSSSDLKKPFPPIKQLPPLPIHSRRRK